MRLCPHASLVCKPASLWPPIARAQLKTNRAFCLSGPSVPGAGTKAENGLGARTNEPTPIPWLARIEHSGSPQTNGESFAAGLSRQLDAVIMLAGGQTPEGGLPPWVERRLDTAHGVLQRQPLSCPILCLGEHTRCGMDLYKALLMHAACLEPPEGGGTPHKPPVLNRDGYVIHESTSCADYLMARGVPALRLLKEVCQSMLGPATRSKPHAQHPGDAQTRPCGMQVSSYDTVGNAMFALTIHAIPAGETRRSQAAAMLALHR